jgi:hypothetical protein
LYDRTQSESVAFEQHLNQFNRISWRVPGFARGNCREGRPITAVHLARMRPLPNLPCREFAPGLGGDEGVAYPPLNSANAGPVAECFHVGLILIAAREWRLTGWLSRKPTRGIAWLRLSASCAKPDCRPGEAAPATSEAFVLI